MWYEIDIDGFIAEISVGDNGGYAISDERALAIRNSFANCPDDTNTHTYRLNTSIEWVAVEKPEPDISDSEALAILLGGEE